MGGSGTSLGSRVIRSCSNLYPSQPSGPEEPDVEADEIVVQTSNDVICLSRASRVSEDSADTGDEAILQLQSRHTSTDSMQTPSPETQRAMPLPRTRQPKMIKHQR